jgi:hypothetical protein
MWKVTRCDSFSELPGFLLEVGTSWTVRSALLIKRRKRKEKKESTAATKRFSY